MTHEDGQRGATPTSGDAASATGKLSSWIGSRMPLPLALRSLGEEHGGRAGAALESMAAEVERGRSLREAFDATAGRFPRGLRRQLRAVTDAGGELTAALPALATLVADQRRLRGRLLATLSYPILVGVSLAALMLLLSWTIVPEFIRLFTDLEVELPPATEFSLQISRQAPAVIGIGALVVGVLVLMAATPGLARYVHWLITGLPLIGPLWTYEGHAALARMLAAYCESRTPAPDALRCAGSGLVDRNLARAALRSAERCDNGGRLSEAMAGSIHFERRLIGQVQSGEANDDLAGAMASAAQTYAEDARRQLEFISRMLPPFMLIVVGGFLVVFVTSLFLPMSV